MKSTIISENISDLSRFKSDMMYQMISKDLTSVALADYIQDVMRAKGLTLKDVAQRSRGVVSVPTVNDIKNGRTTNPTVATLKGLARGLDVPEDEIFDIARGAAEDSGQRTSFDTLSENIRILILDAYDQITPDEARKHKLLADQFAREREKELADFDAAESKRKRKTS